MSLEPIDPESAPELYLADRENNVTAATIYSHRSRLRHFVRWCDDQGITNLNKLTGRQLQKYRLWRRDEGNLAPATEPTFPNRCSKDTPISVRQNQKWSNRGSISIICSLRLLRMILFLNHSSFGQSSGRRDNVALIVNSSTSVCSCK
jgi:hypothetical protein